MGGTRSSDELHRLWLGATQTPNSPNPAAGWRWVTNEPFIFTNWFDGEPNDCCNGIEDNQENNLVFEHQFTPALGWRWNDHDAVQSRPYVVEYDTQPRTCVGAREDAALADRTLLDASSLAAGNFVELGVCAEVRGDVTAGGNALFRSQPWCPVRVTGNVTLGGVLTQQTNTSIIGGTLSQLTPVPPVLVATRAVTPGTVNRQGCTQTVAPGSYGIIEIFGGCTLTLSTGVYNVARFVLHADARLRVNATAGAVQVYASQQFSWGDRVTISNATGPATPVNPASFIAYTNQASQVSIGPDSRFAGHLFAPNAQVSVFSRVIYSGCIQSRQVRLEPDARVQGAPPLGLPVP
jgi:hypothetical protein